MASTEHLYAQLDETENGLSDIREREKRMVDQINGLISAFAADHGCSKNSIDRAIVYTFDALSDLFDDAEGPASRRKIHLENQIGAIEDADLRLSGPVTL